MSTYFPTNVTSILAQLAPGPVAFILNEDDVELAATVDHHRRLGFENIIVLGESPTARDIAATFIPVAPFTELTEFLNQVLDVLAGRWVLALHNAEFLFFPFCENRTIRDVTQFMNEERRDAVFCTTVDIYGATIDRDAAALDFADTWFDRAGYYSTGRFDGPQRLERQIRLFGGLKWRFAEHVPWERQNIDRIALFQARPGLRFDEDGRLNDAEMNTITCPWHHNLTAAIASYRVAKSLIANPGSTYDVDGFVWDQSEKFAWTSEQLMAHGLMEPGQWF